MSPLLKKEIRLLLPGFLTGIVLAFSNFLLPDFGISGPMRDVFVVFPFFCCPAVVVMMALNSFGAEFGFGTFSNLLSQPVARHRVWRVKILLLAGALFIVGSLWCLFFYLRYSPFKMPNNPQDFRGVVIFVWTFLLVVFSGGLWTVLLLRQVAAAFWFTLLTPAAIYVFSSSLTTGLSDAVAEKLVLTVLGVYSIAGFGFARWLFLRLQDTQWSGGAIAMPEMRGLSRWFGQAGAVRRWRPRVALWRKELQLHQSQFIMAGVLVCVHAVVIVTRKLGHFQKNSITEFILESFWWLWLVMPLLVGCAAMAEERKMATLESQLCLPVKRRTQFRIKCGVILVLSVVLGAVMPSLLEGNKFLLSKDLNGLFVHYGNHQGPGGFPYCFPYFSTADGAIVGLVVLQLISSLLSVVPFLFMAVICAGVGAIAFYGSSLARNTLQGLAPSVLGLLIVWFVSFVASRPYQFGLGFLWHGSPLFFLIATPVMIGVVAVLAYGNCQRMQITASVWLKNLLALGIALALVTAATSAMYHRTWELLTATEPTHGPARWTTAHAPRMQITDQTITVYLPDGRVWMNRYVPYYPSPFESKILEDRTFGGGKFLEGTNWTDVRDCLWDIVGVQRDGSLWVSKQPDNKKFYDPLWIYGKRLVSKTTELGQFGDTQDWKDVSGHCINPFLLKNDGTLWLWVTNWYGNKAKWPGLHAFLPQRLGKDSDWAKVLNADGRTFLIKTNGEIWVEPPFEYMTGLEYEKPADIKTLEPGSITIGRASYLENEQWTGVAKFFYFGLNSILVGVCEDGKFRELASLDWTPTPNNLYKNSGPHPAYHGTFDWVPKDIQIGKETNWLELAAYDEFAVTLKSDGTLWRWSFFGQPGFRPFKGLDEALKNQPTCFSEHSDWVAVGQMLGGIVSLAADGSLYLWRFQPEMNYYSGYPVMENMSLLQVSRRPIFLGNIFNPSD